MMYQALRGLGVDDPYAGTDALGPATGGPSVPGSVPLTASDLAGATATPDCDPTQQVCHWYCYIPFMATPDCLASFNAGTTAIATGAGQTVGTAAGAVITGASAGLAQGLLNPGGTPGAPMSMTTILMFAAVGGIAAMALLGKK